LLCQCAALPRGPQAIVSERMVQKILTVLLFLSAAPSFAAPENPATAANAPVTAAPANPFAKWEKEISAFEEADRKAFPPKGAVLFVGSSSIRLWKSLEKDFPNHKVINRGFGGSQIIDSVHFVPRIVWPYEPKSIVFFAGTNDINAKKSPEQLFADFKAFVENVREKLPETKINFISVTTSPSRWKQVEAVKAANALIEAYIKEQKNMAFINVFPLTLDEKGEPREQFFLKDRLHMNAEGYALWKKAVEPYLPTEK
jgi:lysophospholipase L1-like esterase